MPLTVEQIAHIRDFIHKRGFTTIEVEMEALDHMASKVEALLEENPEMKLELAISKAHDSFGIFGLSSIEDAIIGNIRVKFRNQFLHYLKYYFTSIYILSLPVLAFIGYSVLKITPLAQFGTGIQVFFLGYGIIWVIVGYLFYYRKNKKWRKKSLIIQMSGLGLMMTQYIFGYGLSFFSKILYMEGVSAYQIVFVAGFVLATISGFASIKLMKWGIDWADEKWLKYA